MQFVSIPFVLLVSVIGFFSIVWISKKIPPYSFFVTIGENTMTVLIWHFILLRIAKLSFDALCGFEFDTQLRNVEWYHQDYWFVYSIASVLGCYGIIKIKDLINKHANTN